MPVVTWIPPNANVLPVFSLTLEASLREVTSLRQQILRIKGENSVRCHWQSSTLLFRDLPKNVHPLL